MVGGCMRIVDQRRPRAALPDLLLKQHGEDAPIHAAMRADAALEASDVDGYRMWKRILRAVEELQGTEPGFGARVH